MKVRGVLLGYLLSTLRCSWRCSKAASRLPVFMDRRPGLRVLHEDLYAFVPITSILTMTKTNGSSQLLSRTQPPPVHVRLFQLTADGRARWLATVNHGSFLPGRRAIVITRPLRMVRTKNIGTTERRPPGARYPRRLVEVAVPKRAVLQSCDAELKSGDATLA